MKNIRIILWVYSLFHSGVSIAQNSLDCNINLYCSDFAPQGIYDNSARSIVHIITENSARCSATLIRQAIGNDNEQGNYLLTAKHCIRAGDLGLGDKLDLSTTVIYFNYSNPDCNLIPNPPDPGKKNRYKLDGGVTFIEDGGTSDMALLKINNPIPPHYKPYYAGWSASPIQVGVNGEFYDIHHPKSDLKKISRATFLSVNSNVVIPRYFLTWVDGITQDGSSGSGLINFNQRVIGTFSGSATSEIFDDTNCEPNRYGNFGKLSLFWSIHNTVRNALNPNNTFGLVGTSGGEVECYSGDLNLDGIYWPAKDYQPNNQIEINCANTIYAAPNGTNGDVLTIKSEADFTFVAGNSIVLKPGFSTENGASFVAKIQPCAAQRRANRDDILPEEEYLALLNSANSENIVEQKNSTNDEVIKSTAVESTGIKQNNSNSISNKLISIPKVSIFPNPNNGEFVLELSNAPIGNYTLQIIDAVGRSVMQQNYIVQVQNLKQNINLQQQGKGIYFVKINSEQINEVRKVVVE